VSTTWTKPACLPHESPTQKEVGGGCWSDSNKQRIAYILQNRVYLGGLNYDGIHEPLISQDLFDMVQGFVGDGVRGKPNLNVDHDYFLAG